MVAPIVYDVLILPSQLWMVVLPNVCEMHPADAGGGDASGLQARARGGSGHRRGGGGRAATRIAAPKQTGFSRWHGDEAARRAVTNNRARLKSGVAREAFKLRAEIVERCFAHNLDRGGMRRTWLRGRENVHKRYLLHVAGHNLSLLMRQLIGAGTPREAVAGGYGGIIVLLTPTGAMLVARGVSQSGQTAFAAAFLIWE